VNALDDRAAPKGLRGWWLAPPRPGMQRLISPWEYRHLPAAANVRFTAAGFQLGLGLVLVSLARQADTDAERRKMFRLSACFLLPALGNLLGGYWYSTIARSAPPRT
jgi:hypothetical protein